MIKTNNLNKIAKDSFKLGDDKKKAVEEKRKDIKNLSKKNSLKTEQNSKILAKEKVSSNFKIHTMNKIEKKPTISKAETPTANTNKRSFIQKIPNTNSLKEKDFADIKKMQTPKDIKGLTKITKINKFERKVSFGTIQDRVRYELIIVVYTEKHNE
jgi:hypothetical protein